MWVILSLTPAFSTAAIESPPPTIEMAPEAATASAIRDRPFGEGWSISKTPSGPFQTIVLAPAMIVE